MPEQLKIYGTVFADFPSGSISEQDWLDLIGAAKLETLSSAIISAARASQNDISAIKRSQNANYLRLYTLFCFEIDSRDSDSLLAILDAEADSYSVTGSTRNKFIGVLLAEVRQAALGIGYTQVQADKLSVDLINQAIPNTFERFTAIQQAQDYLATNSGIWYE